MKRFIYIFLLLMLFIASCTNPNPFENKAPISSFTMSETTATTGTQISFDGSASSDSDGNITNYNWNFGDSNVAVGSTVTHKYTNPGSYTVKLTVTDNSGASNTSSKTIKINQPAVTARASTLGGDDSTFLTLTNTGPKALAWTISVIDDPENTNPQNGSWFTIDHISGNLGKTGSANDSDDIKLTVKPGVKPGRYISTLRVDYEGGPTLYDVVGQVDAQQTGKFTLSTDFDSLTVNPAGGGVYEIKIDRTGGFNGTVALSLAGAPSGITGDFNPKSTTGNSSNLSVSVNNTVAAGDYKLTVRGKSGGIVSELKLNLKVINPNNPSTFSLGLDPSSVVVKQGTSQVVTVTINKSGSFASNVALTAIDLPTGVTAKFDPTSALTSSQLTLTANAAAPVGSYEVTVKGTGGGKSSEIKLGVTVLKGNVDPENASISGIVSTDNDLIAISTASLNNAEFTTNSLEEGSFVPNQLLVAYNENYISTAALADKMQIRQAMVKDLAAKYNFKVIESALPNQADLIEVSSDVLETAKLLSADPNIKYAEPNYYMQLLGIPNDTEISKLWNMAASGLPVAWSEENGSSNKVVVAVIDSGFDLTHPDLVNKFLPGMDFCAKANNADPDNYSCQNGIYDTDPSNGTVGNKHGTHVAGIVAAEGNNNQGVAGAAYGNKVKLIPIKIFNDVGAGLTNANVFTHSIRWAAGLTVANTNTNPNPAKIINISAGGAFFSQTVQDAINEVRTQKGALVIAATGNNGHNNQKLLSPAAMANVVGVGSINQKFKRSCFSNYLEWEEAQRPGKVDIMAGGGALAACSNNSTYGVLSTVPSGAYGIEIGTSMATPLVSGVAALILSKNPSLSVTQLEQKLLASTYYNTSAPYNMNRAEYGAGVIRAELAFGYPGPGDEVSVSATSSNDSAVDKVTLDLSGTSNQYHLTNLKAGTYTVKADATGDSLDLSGKIDVTLAESENKTSQNIYIK